jgi:RHS repeat-associated protein
VQQTVGSSVTNYLWDEASQYGDVVLETDGSGATQASYVLGGDELLAQTRGGTTSYYLTDGQGSVRLLTSSSGAVTDRYTYDAFGNVQSSQGSTVNPYRYTGQQFDSLTGLYSLRARYYDPANGRFTSRDTAALDVSNPVELNRYSYAQENPVNLIDPSGHGDEEEEGGLYAVILGAVRAAGTGVGRLIPGLTEEEIAALLAALGGALGLWLLLHFLATHTLALPGTVSIPATPTPNNQPEYLYHYTPAANIPSILATGLEPSIRRPGDPNSDAQWGDGQYFTDLTPNDASTGSMFQLSRALFNSPWHWGNKTRNDIGWIKIDVSKLYPYRVIRVAPVFSNTYGPRWIYLHPSVLPLFLDGSVAGTGLVTFKP